MLIGRFHRLPFRLPTSYPNATQIAGATVAAQACMDRFEAKQLFELRTTRYAGNKVQQSMQSNDTYTTTERNCYTVTDSQQNVVGYDVSYRLGDKNGKVRMDHKPGDRIPVKNGQLVVETAGGAAP
jgi:hypothetical protein